MLFVVMCLFYSGGNLSGGKKTKSWYVIEVWLGNIEAKGIRWKVDTKLEIIL